MTTIFLVRHCQYQNKTQVIPFRLPGFPLSNQGLECASKLSKYFINKNISAIYTSPILRAHQTTDIIAKSLKLKSFISKLILETNSPFQNMDINRFNQKGGSPFDQSYHLKGGGETRRQVQVRTQKLINQIRTKFKNKNIIIVTHGDPIMTYIRTFNPQTPYIPMGGIIKLDFSSSSPTALPVLTNIS